MSIGLNVRYRPPREEEYWPYLTQRHLSGFLWPFAQSLEQWRVERMEVDCVYTTKAETADLIEQFDAVLRHLDDPTARFSHLDVEVVRERTRELMKRLRGCLAEWDQVEELSFC